MKKTLDFLGSFAVVALFLAGLAALSYHLLRDDGWLEQLYGNTWDFTVRYPMIAVPLIVGAIVAGKLWRDDRVTHGKQSNKVAGLVLYAIAGAGLYYGAHFVIHGTF